MRRPLIGIVAALLVLSGTVGLGQGGSQSAAVKSNIDQVRGKPAIPAGGTPWTQMTDGIARGWAVKTTGGIVWHVYCWNNSASYPVYVKLYDKAGSSAPTTSDTALVKQHGMARANGGGFILSPDNGMVFASGVGIRITKGAALNDDVVVDPNTAACNISVNNLNGT